MISIMIHYAPVRGKNQERRTTRSFTIKAYKEETTAEVLNGSYQGWYCFTKSATA
jgi:hypothetical protein